MPILTDTTLKKMVTHWKMFYIASIKTLKVFLAHVFNIEDWD